MSTDPTKRAAEAQTSPDSPITPLGEVKVNDRDGTLTVSLPKPTVDELGIDADDFMQVGYNAITGQFVYMPADDFDGW